MGLQGQQMRRVTLEVDLHETSGACHKTSGSRAVTSRARRVPRGLRRLT